jgi:hypothetical protein
VGGFMTFTWKILNIYANSENCIDHVRFHITLDSLSSEGYFYFTEPPKIYPELTENQVVHMIENDPSQDIISAIKLRLQEQLEATVQPVRAPWLGAETFTVQI